MVSICLLVAAPPSVASAEKLLIAEFSAETHPLIVETPEPPTKEQIVLSLLEEARFAFSGMIYGFDFVYTPSDPLRKVAEEFDLKPVAQLRWGDPRMRVLDTRTESDLLFARITYSLADFQLPRWQGWQSNSLEHASGLGASSYLKGPSSRHAAIVEAIKNAIREQVRQRVYNRPREIRGSLALLDAPRIAVREGNYEATVRIALDVKSIIPYTIF
ncbi:MAG TPA: hypothetical protein VMW87_01955 [Spirochaetia bacterium]|nr:hypothetical protein [Spirochaetia bacterium]